MGTRALLGHPGLRASSTGQGDPSLGPLCSEFCPSDTELETGVRTPFLWMRLWLLVLRKNQEFFRWKKQSMGLKPLHPDQCPQVKAGSTPRPPPLPQEEGCADSAQAAPAPAAGWQARAQHMLHEGPPLQPLAKPSVFSSHPRPNGPARRRPVCTVPTADTAQFAMTGVTAGDSSPLLAPEIGDCV